MSYFWIPDVIYWTDLNWSLHWSTKWHEGCHDSHTVLKREHGSTYSWSILFAQVKFIPSEKFLDDLTNPYSLGSKTAHHFKIENKVSSFWMKYKQDVAFGIKQNRGNVQECITKDFKSKCTVNCRSLFSNISLLRLSCIPSPLGVFYFLLFSHHYKKWASFSNGEFHQ